MKESKYLRGLDSGEKLDPREKVEQTAKRVGFVIPKVCDASLIIFFRIQHHTSLIKSSISQFSDDPDAIKGPLGKIK